MDLEQLEKQENNPINVLWDDVLMLPVIGMVDSKRAQDIMDIMLEEIERTSSQFVIMDVRGVVVVDSAVANHIVKITKATSLMGCTTIISGITPLVAQSLVHLGIDLGDIVTTARVSDAFSLALKKLGLSIVKNEQS
ncbi:MAG: STAS domain-containing protein [Mariprofundus sp.]|nr:STAS domain-containing protein [Mariprofundus sp.]